MKSTINSMLSNSISKIKLILKNDSILYDVIFILPVLLFYFLLFYSRWQLCPNHTTYSYMAWGTLNGLKPYVDIIDFHLPGIILINIAGFFIGNNGPFGIRLIDTISIFALCISTACIMHRWKVSFPIRIFALTLFLITYFFAGPCETAETDSFSFTFTILGLLPWFLCDLSNQKHTKWLVAGGVFVGLGLWTSIFHIFIVILIIYFFKPTDKDAHKVYLQNISIFLSGILGISLIIIAWLVVIGSLDGFIQWGGRFYFNEYLQAQWPLKTLLDMLFKRILYLDEKWPFVFAACVLLLPYALNEKQHLNLKRKELNMALSLVLVSILLIIFQGKVLQHQLISLQFSLVLLGALISSTLTIPKIFSNLKFIPIIFCIIFATYTGYGYTKRIKTTKPIQELVNELKKYMTDDQTFVVFGAAPFLYSELLRSTPYPFINSLSMYETSKPQSNTRKKIIGKLAEALEDKRIKFFLVHHQSTIPFYNIEDTRGIIGRQIGIKKLKELGLMKNTSVFEFDVFEKFDLP